MNNFSKARPEPHPTITVPNALGVISNIHARGFGFISYQNPDSERPTRIWFHLMDSDGTVFLPNDPVVFDLGTDSEDRPRGYNVKLAHKSNPTVQS